MTRESVVSQPLMGVLMVAFFSLSASPMPSSQVMLRFCRTFTGERVGSTASDPTSILRFQRPLLVAQIGGLAPDALGRKCA